MYNYDRKEAGVFLIGLLLTCGDNWEKRRAIATALYDVQTEGCVNVLVGELKRMKNKNSTRRYLNEVIDVLSCMPPPLVLPRLEELMTDNFLSPSIRAKVESVGVISPTDTNTDNCRCGHPVRSRCVSSACR